MKLRKLKIEDAPFMLEWMHDLNVVQHMKVDFRHKTLEDCEKFILDNQQDDLHNLNLAITDENGTYVGTVSLKNISNNSAEFAIVVRSSAMGKGYSKYAMEEIMKIGFEERGLSHIYWCVSPENKRAIRFYNEKMKASTIHPEQLLENTVKLGGGQQIQSYIWYCKTKR